MKNTFRTMRRFRQQLTEAETEGIFKNGTSGVLALSGDEGYPYAVPISYVYADGVLYFHGAKSGHKMDAIRRDNKASFCVIQADDVVPEEYTTYFKSAVAFGKIRILEEEAEIRAAADVLGARYRPGHEEERKQEIEKSMKALCMFRLDVEHMTGKQSIELVRRAEKAGTDH